MAVLKLPEMLEAEQRGEAKARESCWPAALLGGTAAVAAQFMGQNIKVVSLSSQISRVRFVLLFAIHCLWIWLLLLSSWACFSGRNNALYHNNYYYKLSLHSLILNENSIKNGVCLPGWGFHLSMAFLKAWLGWFGVCDAGPGSGAMHLGDTQDLQGYACFGSNASKPVNFWGDSSLVWWHHTNLISCVPSKENPKLFFSTIITVLTQAYRSLFHCSRGWKRVKHCWTLVFLCWTLSSTICIWERGANLPVKFLLKHDEQSHRIKLPGNLATGDSVLRVVLSVVLCRQAGE